MLEPEILCSMEEGAHARCGRRGVFGGMRGAPASPKLFGYNGN